MVSCPEAGCKAHPGAGELVPGSILHLEPLRSEGPHKESRLEVALASGLDSACRGESEAPAPRGIPAGVSEFYPGPAPMRHHEPKPAWWKRGVRGPAVDTDHDFERARERMRWHADIAFAVN
jgi:hypothetical protein